MCPIKHSTRVKQGVIYVRFKHPRTREWLERSTGTGSVRGAEGWLERLWHSLLKAPDEAPLPRIDLAKAAGEYAAKTERLVMARSPDPRVLTNFKTRLNKLRLVVRALGGDTPLADITAKTIRDWRDARLLETSASTVHKLLNEARGFFRFAVDQGYLRTDPSAGIRVKVEHQKVDRSLTVEEVEALFDAIAPARRIYLLMMFELGVRPGREVEAIRWSGVDFERAMVHVPGTKTRTSNRHLPVRPAFLAVLEGERARTGAPDDAPVVARWTNAGRDLKDACRIAGIRHVRRYDFRHTYTSLALQAGVPDAFVAAALGHANTNMVHDTYGHLKVEHLRAVPGALPEISYAGETARHGAAEPAPPAASCTLTRSLTGAQPGQQSAPSPSLPALTRTL